MRDVLDGLQREGPFRAVRRCLSWIDVTLEERFAIVMDAEHDPVTVRFLKAKAEKRKGKLINGELRRFCFRFGCTVNSMNEVMSKRAINGMNGE